MKTTLAPFNIAPLRNIFIDRVRSMVRQGRSLNLTERFLGIMALNQLLSARRFGGKNRGVVISDVQIACLAEAVLDISPARADRAPIPEIQDKGGIFTAKS